MIENPCNMSDAEVREWAYSWDVELLDQDEDILLHDARYMPVLAECARDPACPKAEYIVGIIGSFGQLRLLHRRVDEARSVVEALRTQVAMPRGDRLTELSYLLPAFEKLVSPRVLSEAEADGLAYDLLIRHSVRALLIEPELVGGNKVYTYKAPYQPFLYISVSTGHWTYSPMKRLSPADLTPPSSGQPSAAAHVER